MAACLELQLEELDALSATYDASEVTCEGQCDGGVDNLRLLQESGDDAAKTSLPEIVLIYHFTLTCENAKSPVLLEVRTPRDYPGHCAPRVYARSDSFTRKSGSDFNDKLDAEVKRVFDESQGAGIIFSIVQYVSEQASTFLEVMCTDSGASAEVGSEVATLAANEIHRGFVTYHHMLYGNEHKKEQKVVDLAKIMGLSGLISYGKPSLVCVECSSDDELKQFLSESKRVGKEGSLTYVEKDSERRCNNGKPGFQQVKAQGKSGETPDQHAIISFLTALGLKDKRKVITGCK